MRRIAWLGLALAGCQATPRVPDPLGPVVADLEAFAAGQRASLAIPGIWYGVLALDPATGEEVRWHGALGQRRADPAAPAQATDRLPMASLSKVLTATAALHLAAQGRLDLAAPVTASVPELRLIDGPPHDLSLRDLLCHRGRLPAWPPVGHRADTSSPPLAAVVGSLAAAPRPELPRGGFAYSNAGYAVVGRAIERATGRAFADAMDALVLAPLGMGDATFAPGDDAVAGRMATLDGRAIDWPADTSGCAPAIGLRATVADLLTFARTWLPRPRVPLLDAATLQAQFAGDGDAVGLGCFGAELQGQRTLVHGGTGPGVASHLLVLPEPGIAVVVVGSLDGANAVVQAIAERAVCAVLAQRRGESLPPPQWPTPVGVAAARELAGRYRLDGQWFDLRERAGELWFDPCIGVATRMRRLHDALVSDDRFDQGNRRLHVPRAGVVHDGYAEFARDPARAPSAPPASVIEVLGEYGPPHDTLIVYEDGGQPYCLLHWQARESLRPVAVDRFAFGPGANALVLEFERDAAGRVVAARLDGVRLLRKPDPDPQGFRIAPVRPIAELRALAARSAPPPQPPGLRAPDLVTLADLSPTLQFDIRYATADNFLGTAVYEHAIARLQRPAAQALLAAHTALAAHGYGLCIFDAYRPWSVTKVFFEATPPDLRHFVADPAQGSRHNRGCAVDLTLYELATGAVVEMPSGFDEFTERAYPDWPGGTERQRWHRELLRRAMEDAGFSVYEHEWWHYDFADWRQYPVLDEPLR